MEIPSEHGWLLHHLSVQFIIAPPSSMKHQINKELHIFVIIIIKLNSNVLEVGPMSGFWGQTAVKAQLNIDQPHTES